MSIDKILNIIKRTKSETNVDISCTVDSLISENERLTQVKAVEKKLQIESTEQIFQNMTDEILKTAAEMYIYLGSCPNPVKPWIYFYKDLFQNESPDLILLTLNRLVKSSGTSSQKINDLITVAQSLLRKYTPLFSIEYERAENDTAGRQTKT